MGTWVDSVLERLARIYDPENDLIPDAPRVTHTDMIVIDAVIDLRERVESLETEVRTLKRKTERSGR